MEELSVVLECSPWANMSKKSDLNSPIKNLFLENLMSVYSHHRLTDGIHFIYFSPMLILQLDFQFKERYKSEVPNWLRMVQPP